MNKVFIQDRKATNSKPEEGDRYVLTEITGNGNVNDLAYSNNVKEIKELARDRNYRLEETSKGWDCLPFCWERTVNDNTIKAYQTWDRMMGDCWEVKLNNIVVFDRTNKETAQHILNRIEKGLEK